MQHRKGYLVPIVVKSYKIVNDVLAITMGRSLTVKKLPSPRFPHHFEFEFDNLDTHTEAKERLSVDEDEHNTECRWLMLKKGETEHAYKIITKRDDYGNYGVTVCCGSLCCYTEGVKTAKDNQNP